MHLASLICYPAFSESIAMGRFFIENFKYFIKVVSKFLHRKYISQDIHFEA
jgi:hypothetical protein